MRLNPEKGEVQIRLLYHLQVLLLGTSFLRSTQPSLQHLRLRMFPAQLLYPDPFVYLNLKRYCHEHSSLEKRPIDLGKFSPTTETYMISNVQG